MYLLILGINRNVTCIVCVHCLSGFIRLRKRSFLILCHPGGKKDDEYPLVGGQIYLHNSGYWKNLWPSYLLSSVVSIAGSFLPFIRIISYWWRMNDKRWGVNDLLECTYYQLEYKGISSKRILRSLVSNKNSIAQIKNLLSRRIETMNEMGKPRTKYLYKMDDVICKQ